MCRMPIILINVYWVNSTRLYLNPITSYSEQWYEESYLGGYKMQEADPRLFNYLKFTASDKNGKFAFYGVPSGSYYLIGTVKCGEECGYDSMKNIRIATKVSVPWKSNSQSRPDKDDRLMQSLLTLVGKLLQVHYKAHLESHLHFLQAHVAW